MTAVTINGNAYSDDGTQSRDMRFGGHQQWLLPMLQDAMTEVEAATDAAVSADSSAAAAATSASNAANYAAALNGTSTSSNDIGTGSKTWTTQTGKQFGVGGYVQIIRQTDTTMWMIGQVTAYNTGTGSITVNVEDSNGSGNFSGWDIRVSGKRGAQGLQGADGTISVPYTGKTATFTPVSNDKGKIFDCTSGTYGVTFSSAASLGANWFCYIRNSGTGDITLDPNGSETIDGLTSFVLYPGAVRLVQCDGTTLRSVPLAAGTKKFTLSGTYVISPGLSALDCYAVGPGGGGASGQKVANGFTMSSGNGGGGGGGGQKTDRRIYTPTAGASVTVTVPSGGSGGAAKSSLSGAEFSVISATLPYTSSNVIGYDQLKLINNKIVYVQSYSSSQSYVVDPFNGATNYNTASLQSIAWDGTNYVAVGQISGATSAVYKGTTIGGMSDTTASPAAYPLNVIDYCSTIGLFATAATNGAIYTSPNGMTWTNRTSPFGSYVYHINNNGTYFVAVGAGGKIAKSTDGITWSLQTSGTTDDLCRVVWSATRSLWVATGLNSRVLTSPDGAAWTSRTYGGAATDLYTLAEAGGTFYASQPHNGNMRTSTDGTTWNVWSTATPVSAGVTLVACAGSGGSLIYARRDVTAGQNFLQSNSVMPGVIGTSSGSTSFGTYLVATAGAGGLVTGAQGANGTTGAGGGGYGAYFHSSGSSGNSAQPFLTIPNNGGAIGASGGVGTVTNDSQCGTGGGGGGGSNSTNAGNGGNGGDPGGGGGGGGATSGSGASSSGAGGTGGRGEVLVVEVI